jgi:hypothetical protein
MMSVVFDALGDALGGNGEEHGEQKSTVMDASELHKDDTVLSTARRLNVVVEQLRDLYDGPPAILDTVTRLMAAVEETQHAETARESAGAGAAAVPVTDVGADHAARFEAAVAAVSRIATDCHDMRVRRQTMTDVGLTLQRKLDTAATATLLGMVMDCFNSEDDVTTGTTMLVGLAQRPLDGGGHMSLSGGQSNLSDTTVPQQHNASLSQVAHAASESMALQQSQQLREHDVARAVKDENIKAAKELTAGLTTLCHPTNAADRAAVATTALGVLKIIETTTKSGDAAADVRRRAITLVTDALRRRLQPAESRQIATAYTLELSVPELSSAGDIASVRSFLRVWGKIDKIVGMWTQFLSAELPLQLQWDDATITRLQTAVRRGGSLDSLEAHDGQRGAEVHNRDILRVAEVRFASEQTETADRRPSVVMTFLTLLGLTGFHADLPKLLLQLPGVDQHMVDPFCCAKGDLDGTTRSSCRPTSVCYFLDSLVGQQWATARLLAADATELVTAVRWAARIMLAAPVPQRLPAGVHHGLAMSARLATQTAVRDMEQRNTGEPSKALKHMRVALNNIVSATGGGHGGTAAGGGDSMGRVVNTVFQFECTVVYPPPASEPLPVPQRHPLCAVALQAAPLPTQKPCRKVTGAAVSQPSATTGSRHYQQPQQQEEQRRWQAARTQYQRRQAARTRTRLSRALAAAAAAKPCRQASQHMALAAAATRTAAARSQNEQQQLQRRQQRPRWPQQQQQQQPHQKQKQKQRQQQYQKQKPQRQPQQRQQQQQQQSWYSAPAKESRRLVRRRRSAAARAVTAAAAWRATKAISSYVTGLRRMLQEAPRHDPAEAGVSTEAAAPKGAAPTAPTAAHADQDDDFMLSDAQLVERDRRRADWVHAQAQGLLTTLLLSEASPHAVMLALEDTMDELLATVGRLTLHAADDDGACMPAPHINDGVCEAAAGGEGTAT